MPGTKSTSSIYTSNQKAASSDTPLLTGTKPIPFIHTSDLVHPTWDPDDQVDLGCLYALPEFDLKAIIIDNHIDNSKMHMYEPAFSLISQLNWLTGKAVPAAVGPNTKLLSPSDDGSHYSLRNQAGIKLLIEKLREVDEPAIISIVGSSRTVAAAFNREPELFREKVRAILFVAGRPVRKKGDRLDTNSRFDPNAFIAILRSGLPIWWSPCGLWTVEPSEANGPNYKELFEVGYAHSSKLYTPHTQLFEKLPKKLHACMMYGFTGNQRGDIIRALHEEWYAGMWWGVVKGGNRALSSIPICVMAANRTTIKTREGWRFIPEDQVQKNADEYKLSLIPVKVQVDDDAHTTWEVVKESNILLFTRNPDQELYDKVIGEAVNGLLRSIPLEDSSPGRK